MSRKYKHYIAICLLFLLLFCSVSQASLAPLDKVYVNRVIDGDTFEVFGGIKVRMIGVDTPEINQDKVEYYAEEAARFTRKNLENRTVYLEYGIQRYDEYGRVLANVFLEDGTFFNARLLTEGYACLLTIPPNVKYTELFRKCTKRAIVDNQGLWDKIPLISWQKADKYVGKKVVVKGKVVDTYNSGKAVFLNFHEDYRHNFTAVIFDGDLEDFQVGPAEYYLDKQVLITGKVKIYKEAPEIIIKNPEQIYVKTDINTNNHANPP